jgi:voltage-gated potassium channel
MWIEFIYSYMHANDKRKYFENNFITIIGMLPVDFVFLRALRLIKLLQLIKIYVLSKDDEELITNFLKRTYLDKIIVTAILFVFAITVLICLADPSMNSVHDALWYVLVSMTSTGYGDIVPATPSGYIIGAVAIIGGILIFSAITAVISSIYVSKISRHNHEGLESKIDDLTSEVEELKRKIDELKEEI